MGQEQDSLAGAFESSQSFQGLLANLNVWDYVLCPKVIARMSNACASAWVGNCIDGIIFRLALKGNLSLLFHLLAVHWVIKGFIFHDDKF